MPEHTPAGEVKRAREIAERLAEYDAREPYSVDVLRDAAPSDIRWLLAELGALVAKLDDVRGVILRRHERLSAALGDDPGYSVDMTIDKAIARIEALTRDAARLDFLEAWRKGDQSICPPGNHGGDAANWLLSQDRDHDSYGAFCNEYEGPTLRETIDAARAALSAGEA